MPGLWTKRTLPTAPWTALRQTEGLPTSPQPLLQFFGSLPGTRSRIGPKTHPRVCVTDVVASKCHRCLDIHPRLPRTDTDTSTATLSSTSTTAERLLDVDAALLTGLLHELPVPVIQPLVGPGGLLGVAQRAGADGDDLVGA